LSKSAIKVATAFTDIAPALSVREFVDVPTALVVNACSEEQNRSNGWVHFNLGHICLAVTNRHKADETAILSCLGSLELFDLAEPFARIREAIEETRRPSRAA
jgi:hypothetical protein